MLELRYQNPMPHAVLPFEQPLAHLSPRSRHKDTTRTLPAPHSLLIPSTSRSAESVDSAKSWTASARVPPIDTGSPASPLAMYGAVGRGYGQTSDASVAAMADVRPYNPYRSPHAHRGQQPQNAVPRQYPVASNVPEALRRSPSRQQAPTRTGNSEVPNERRKHAPTSVAPSLQIPPEINVRQSGMPQLAAEITCLFWFEDSTLLQRIESTDRELIPTIAKPLVPEARPSTGFTKWVATILSTTQVTQNVIMLALLFIYRLKHINPVVKGKPGSEFRLLTVALMLGNKFLDDNTYTNKTWAEVSGISVQEVHLMEVEFLSNMRYSLYASEKDWAEWKTKLSKFGDYFHYASIAGQSTPKGRGLPSPPVSAQPSPPSRTSFHFQQPPAASTGIVLPQMVGSGPSSVRPLPELDVHYANRKRGHDENQSVEPPLKRQDRTRPIHTLPRPPTQAPPNPPQRSLPPLPVPNLSAQIQHANTLATQMAQQLPLPGQNAMSFAYPQAPPQPQSHTSHVSTVGIPSTMATSLPPLSTATHIPAPLDLRPPPRNLSPYPGSTNVSPVSATFPNANGTVTPTHTQPPQHFAPGSSGLPVSAISAGLPASHLSPSHFLAQRSSPYRPIRAVQTLLVPPPSGMMGALRNAALPPTSSTITGGHAVTNGPFSGGFDMTSAAQEPRLQYRSLGRNFGETKLGRLPYVGPWVQTPQAPIRHPDGSYAATQYGWQQPGPTSGGNARGDQQY